MAKWSFCATADCIKTYWETVNSTSASEVFSYPVCVRERLKLQGNYRLYTMVALRSRFQPLKLSSFFIHSSPESELVERDSQHSMNYGLDNPFFLVGLASYTTSSHSLMLVTGGRWSYGCLVLKYWRVDSQFISSVQSLKCHFERKNNTARARSSPRS